VGRRQAIESAVGVGDLGKSNQRRPHRQRRQERVMDRLRRHPRAGQRLPDTPSVTGTIRN
jgi:hypothetical protein